MSTLPPVPRQNIVDKIGNLLPPWQAWFQSLQAYLASSIVTYSVFTSSASGLAPASGGGTTNFLRADGTWSAPAGGGSGANPSASIGLTAVDGVATSFLRSDGAPALSQAIAPTWTGLHTFDAKVVLNAPSSGVNLTVNGVSGSALATFASASATTTQAGDIAITRASSTANSVLAGANIVLQDLGASTYSVLQQSGGQTELWQYNAGAWQEIAHVGTSGGVVVGGATGGDKGFGTVNAAGLYINGVAVGSSLPSTIADLQYWFDASVLNASAGFAIPALQNSAPNYAGMTPVGTNTGNFTVSATQLNSRNVITGGGTGGFEFPTGSSTAAGPVLSNATVFIVFNASNVSAAGAFCSGSSGALEFYVSGGVLNLASAFVGTIGSDTTTLTAGTWYQANVTYNDTTGAYAFRVSRAAGASGSAIQSISNPSNCILFTTGASQTFNGSLGEQIEFNRVLTLAQIQSVESYLHTKWGV